MCTVTVIPLGTDGSYRVVFNRDELRTRPAAQPPSIERFGERRAMLPRDPAGGTWIASSDAGVTFALLNYNPQVRAAGPADTPARSGSPPPPSRGLIIPKLLSMPDANQAVASVVRSVDPREHAPFRMLILDGRTRATITSGRAAMVVEHVAWDGTPFMLTSSSLGDSVVSSDRLALFRTMVLRGATNGRRLVSAQDSFHAHRWPDRPALSVLMSRADARTVSRTNIEASESLITMGYESFCDCSGRGAPTAGECSHPLNLQRRH